MTALQDWWGAIMPIVAVVVWLVRLEARASRNTEEIRQLETRWIEQRKEDIASRQREFDNLRDDMSEMKKDIKEILSRVGK